MRAYACDAFELPLPPGHRFPMTKYRLLRERIERCLPGIQLCEPQAATDRELALAHTPEWIDRFGRGAIDQREQRRIGFPWSAALVERSRRSVGATLAACRSAFEEGASVNLAGGTHHAGRDFGEGFCCFNDVAVAARVLLAEARVERVAIVDLDVHQGNGSAQILYDDAAVFTLSVQGARNYPYTSRFPSDLDVDLEDGTSDEAYLAALDAALAEMSGRFQPQFLIYLAGADVYAGDRLGRLSLSIEGIAARDQRVFDFARHHGVPVATVMGGGYCPRIDEIVSIHFGTVQAAMRYSERYRAGSFSSDALTLHRSR